MPCPGPGKRLDSLPPYMLSLRPTPPKPIGSPPRPLLGGIPRLLPNISRASSRLPLTVWRACSTSSLRYPMSSSMLYCLLCCHIMSVGFLGPGAFMLLLGQPPSNPEESSWLPQPGLERCIPPLEGPTGLRPRLPPQPPLEPPVGPESGHAEDSLLLPPSRSPQPPPIPAELPPI